MRSLCCVSPGGFQKQPFLPQCRKWTWGALCKHPRESVSVWPWGHGHGGDCYDWSLPLPENQSSYFFFFPFLFLFAIFSKTFCSYLPLSFICYKVIGGKKFLNWKHVKTISGENTHTHICGSLLRQDLINFASKRSCIWFGNYLQEEKWSNCSFCVFLIYSCSICTNVV